MTAPVITYKESKMIVNDVEYGVDEVRNLVTNHEMMVRGYARLDNEVSMLVAMLNYVGNVRYCIDDDEGGWSEVVDECAGDATSHAIEEYRDVLISHDIVPETRFEREYHVHVTIPVTITLSISATDEREAEEKAQNEVEMNGLDQYYPEYNLYYDAEFHVEEL